ncbi:MAG: DUF971 domain-containing protein [Planctomycetes bacterium]|nr:DUF971 domain-containing protein [Planctomycetota bacterium]
MTQPPTHIDLQKEKGLRLDWADGESVFFPIDYLRKMSPSADSKALRDELENNPLAILQGSNSEPLTALGAELVGNYAIRISFSDGHTAGIYSWEYLRSLEGMGHG